MEASPCSPQCTLLWPTPELRVPDSFSHLCPEHLLGPELGAQPRPRPGGLTQCQALTTPTPVPMETPGRGENIGKTLSDVHHSRILQDPPPRILEIKAKINKWDLIKSFCTTKETISKVKRQPSEWEKIIANEATDKQLISKIQKQHLQLNSRKINDPIKKWAKELNRHFSKEDIQMANKHMKRCSTSLIIREMQIKTTVTYYFMPVRMTAIKSTNKNC